MRISTFIVTLAAGTMLSAQSLSVPVGKWANWLTAIPGQDQLTDVALDADGNVYWYGTPGTSDSNRNVTYAGEFLFLGAPYADTNNTTKNLCVLKTDSDGHKEWVVYSSSGDFLAGYGGLAMNSEGDIIFYGMARNTLPANPIVLCDSKGNSLTITKPEEYRFYKMVLGCVSTDGVLKWARAYDISNAPVSDATGSAAIQTSQAILTCGVTVDDTDNIYVSGSFCTEMTFPRADGSAVSLTPLNVDGWNGDAQVACGSLFIVKMDSEGYYIDSFLQDSGEITASAIREVKWADGRLYVCGYLKGKGGAPAGIAGYDFIPTDYMCPIVGALNSDLSVCWLHCYPADAVAGKNALQNVGMTVGDGCIWLAGQYNGKISSPFEPRLSVESTQGSMREGFVIKLSAEDGSWIAARNSRTDFPQSYLTGYMRVILPDSAPDKIYVYGYAMNANVGVFLREYDKETLVGDPLMSWNLLTGGGAPTCLANVAYSPELCSIFVGARGNQPFTLLEGEKTSNPGGYTMLLSRFSLPEVFASGVMPVGGEDAAEWLQVIASEGTIRCINTSDWSTTVVIYDITGREVALLNVDAHSASSASLATGSYIVNGKKLLL